MRMRRGLAILIAAGVMALFVSTAACAQASGAARAQPTAYGRVRDAKPVVIVVTDTAGTPMAGAWVGVAGSEFVGGEALTEWTFTTLYRADSDGKVVVPPELVALATYRLRVAAWMLGYNEKEVMIPVERFSEDTFIIQIYPPPPLLGIEGGCVGLFASRSRIVPEELMREFRRDQGRRREVEMEVRRRLNQW